MQEGRLLRKIRTVEILYPGWMRQELCVATTTSCRGRGGGGEETMNGEYLMIWLIDYCVVYLSWRLQGVFENIRKELSWLTLALFYRNYEVPTTQGGLPTAESGAHSLLNIAQ
jgi:hypothetical protein